MFNLTRGEELTALLAVALVGVATFVVCLHRGDKGKTVEIPLNNPANPTVQDQRRGSQRKILVHLSGEVHEQGVLELNSGSRVKDAIELARPTENADLGRLNLAAFLLDGERIVVPRKGGAARKGEAPGRAEGATPVNVNTATQEQLESLPGIGPALAGRILEYRRTRKFDTVDDLLQVRGIGPATLEKIREHVRVK